MKKTLAIVAFSAFVVTGVALAGAKELREKANKLWTQANVDHEKAIQDFDAAVALQYKSDGERAEARKLYWEAYLLDKEGRKEWLEHAIKAHETRAKHLQSAIKQRKEYATHLEALIKSEEKSIADLKAAEKAETNAKTKAGEEMIIGNDQEEVNGYKARLEDDREILRREEIAFKAEEAVIKKLQDELKKL